MAKFWKEGRQGGGYRKLTLLNCKRFKFDLHFISMPTGSSVPWHTDPSPEGHEHHRVNLTLRRPRSGGETWIEAPFVMLRVPRRCYRFRPDLARHCVTPIEDGELWLLSFGWLSKL